MKVFHASSNKYEFPSYEEILKNTKNHSNSLLGLWFSNSENWIENFGENIYSFEFDEKNFYVMSISELSGMNNEVSKKINILSDENMEEEKINQFEKNFYINKRNDLKQKYDYIMIKESDGNFEMGIILNFNIIKNFNIYERKNKVKIKI